MPRPLRLILMVFLAIGCGAGAAAPASNTAPSTRPAAPVRLAAAVPLEQFQADDVDTNLTEKLSPPQSGREMYFGEIDRYIDDDADEPSDAVPILAVRDGDAWKAVPLLGPGLSDAGWKFVGSGPRPKEIWGALDTSAGDSRANFVLAHSTDAGASFMLVVIRKPCRQMTFFDFAMDRGGTGRATLSLDADCGQFHPGLYSYLTHDAGRTWSEAPKFEADDTNRADTVPDDEQPQAPQPPTGSKTAMPGHAAEGAAVVRTLLHVR